MKYKISTLEILRKLNRLSKEYLVDNYELEAFINESSRFLLKAFRTNFNDSLLFSTLSLTDKKIFKFVLVDSNNDGYYFHKKELGNSYGEIKRLVNNLVKESQEEKISNFTQLLLGKKNELGKDLFISDNTSRYKEIASKDSPIFSFSLAKLVTVKEVATFSHLSRRIFFSGQSFK